MLGFGFLIAFDTAAARLPVVVVARPRRAVARRGAVRRSHRHARRCGRSTLGCARPRPCSVPRPAAPGVRSTLPLAGRAFAVAAGFAFAIALGEFGATVFVARAEQPTLPVAIFRFLGRPGAENQGIAAALAVVLAVIAVVCARSLRSALADGTRRRLSDARAVGAPGSCSAATTRARRCRPRRRGRRDVVAVLGPSGSGKSTLLRVDRRAAAPRRGLGHARRPSARRASRRTGGASASCSRTTRCSRTATSPRTSPSVSGCRAVGAAAASSRVAELLDLVGLEGRERRAVGSLSGGERKRVALARALAPAPRVLLLDEPLGALDRPLHDRLVEELSDLFAAIGQTALYVTHDVGRGVRARLARRGDA